MAELSPAEDSEAPEPEKIRFNSPEDVLIEVVGPHDDDPENRKWENWSIESTTVIRGEAGVTGAASYEKSYGGFLDYTIEGLIEVPGEGWFIVEKVTAVYHRGDGWTTDDDMEFLCKGVRPATKEEIKLA